MHHRLKYNGRETKKNDSETRFSKADKNGFISDMTKEIKKYLHQKFKKHLACLFTQKIFYLVAGIKKQNSVNMNKSR